MALFKRALWHSGLKYRNHCINCNTTVEYDDYQLDFRPWFPDGYVYCPKCRKPLRHSEQRAVDENGNPLNFKVSEEKSVPSDGTFAYCANCGKKHKIGANFCVACGSKLKEE